MAFPIQTTGCAHDGGSPKTASSASARGIAVARPGTVSRMPVAPVPDSDEPPT